MDIGIAMLGLFVGFLVGLTGVGGAAILTPMLVWMGINPSIAIGTDLLYNSVTKFFGAVQHYRQKSVDIALVKYLAMGSIPGAFMAVLALLLFNSFFDNQEELLQHALGFMLICVAILTIAKLFFRKKEMNGKWRNKPNHEKKGLSVAIGFVLGFLVGLTSIGSGSLFALALLYFYQIQSSKVVGTDIAHAFLLVSAAGIMHAFLGHVDYRLMANLLIGSIPGIIIGSVLSVKVPEKPLRTVIATLILISGIKLI